MSKERTPHVLVLGASGLIGRFITDDLRGRGLHVVGVARKFSASQRMTAFDLQKPLLAMDASALSQLMRDQGADVIVNCLGVLQDGPGSDTGAVHRDFVARLLHAMQGCGRAMRLVHISIPGTAEQDRTAFSTTKREAETLIAASGVAHAILAGLRGRTISLWRQRHAARARCAADRSAGRGSGDAVPAGGG
jgi:uncharacterized protein YbjT (DUF2867 family)